MSIHAYDKSITETLTAHCLASSYTSSSFLHFSQNNRKVARNASKNSKVMYKKSIVFIVSCVLQETCGNIVNRVTM